MASNLRAMALVASLLLVAMPGAPSSILVTTSDGLPFAAGVCHDEAYPQLGGQRLGSPFLSFGQLSRSPRSEALCVERKRHEKKKATAEKNKEKNRGFGPPVRGLQAPYRVGKGFVEAARGPMASSEFRVRFREAECGQSVARTFQRQLCEKEQVEGVDERFVKMKVNDAVTV